MPKRTPGFSLFFEFPVTLMHFYKAFRRTNRYTPEHPTHVMRIPWNTFAPAVVCAATCVAILLSGSNPAGAQDKPKDDPRDDPRLEGWVDTGSPGVPDQAARMEAMLDHYREIQRRGGWKKVPTDLTMGPEYTYDCSRIEA